MSLRRSTLAVTLSALVIGPFLLTATAQAATTPPWEPDANSVGGLLFFDSSGHAVTGGLVSDPLPTYIEGSQTIRSGDTKATLYGYLPKSGQAPGAFEGEALAGPSTYPNSSAPSPVSQTLPVVTVTGTDGTIAQLIADFPNTDTSTDGYAHLYQLRLRTTQSGLPSNTTYDAADILITGTGSSTSWSIDYDSAITAATTTTTLAVSPSATAYHGSSVKLTASVTPASAPGTVYFYDGTKEIGAGAVTNGTATFTTKTLTDATHQLAARYASSDKVDYAGSVSAAHQLVVKAHPTTLVLHASATRLRKGHKLVLTATVTPAFKGSVTFFDGSRKLKTATVSAGKASYSTTTLKVGTHRLTARFSPASPADDSPSSSKPVTVRVVA